MTSIATVLRAGVYAVPFLPLYVSTPLLYPYVTGRNFAFRIITEVLLVPLAALWVASQRHRPQLTPIAIALLAFVAVVALVDAIGVHPMRSIWSTFQRMDGLLRLIHDALLFVILKVSLETTDHWRRYFTLSVAVSALVALMGLLEYALASASGQFRSVSGTIGNGGIFAGYLMLHAFVSVMLLRAASPRTTKLLIAAICLNLVAAYLSGNRSSMLALVIVGPVAAVAWYGGRRLLIPAVVLLVSGVLYTSIFGIPLAERFQRGTQGVGRSSREVAWSAAVNTIRERPWLGWGQENFYLGWDRHYAAAGETGFDRAHSTPLEWLIAGGALAFAAYATLMAAFAWTIWRLGRADERSAIGIGAVFGAYTIFSLFWFDTLETQVLFVSVLAFADWSLHRARGGDDGIAFAVVVSRPAIIAGAVAAIVAGIAVYALNVRPLLAAHAANDGLVAWRARGSLADSRAAFARAFGYEGFYAQDPVEAMASFAPSAIVIGASSNAAEVHAFTALAIGELQTLIASGPPEARHLVMLGRIAGSASTFDPAYRGLAIDSFARARALSPNNEQIYQAMARFYAASGEYDAAFAMQRRAIELAPQSPGLELELLRLKLASGVATPQDYAALRKVLASQIDFRGVVLGYVQSGEFEMARLAIEEMLRRDPGNPDLRQQHEAILGRLDATRRTPSGDVN